MHGALRAFQQAMHCAPGTPEPAYNLGVALEHFGLWDGALAAFQAAVECARRSTSDARTGTARWRCCAEAGRFDEVDFREYEWRFRRGEPGAARLRSRGRCGTWAALANGEARSSSGP